MKRLNQSSIPHQEYMDRRELLRKRLTERQLDGVLVISRGGNDPIWGADILYLTNHYSPFSQIPDFPGVWSGRSHSALVMPADNDGTLVVDIPDWRRDLVVMENVQVSLDLWAGIVSALKDQKLADKRIGLIGKKCVPHIAIEYIKEKLPSVEFVWCDEIIEEMRMIKSPSEIALLRHASKVGGDMMTAFMSSISPGKTEADCIVEALKAGIPQGAFVIDMPVAAGPYSDHFIYHQRPSWDYQRPLEVGEMIHPDLMGTVNGYIYDFIRSSVVGGKPNDEQREVLEASRDAVQHIIEGMKPGIKASELYERGAEWLKDRGMLPPGAEGEVAQLGQNFPSFGHGIGLTWEAPWITPHDHTILQPGMSFSIEVYVGREETGTSAFEQSVVITESGIELLTADTKTTWWE